MKVIPETREMLHMSKINKELCVNVSNFGKYFTSIGQFTNVKVDRRLSSVFFSGIMNI